MKSFSTPVFACVLVMCFAASIMNPHQGRTENHADCPLGTTAASAAGYGEDSAMTFGHATVDAACSGGVEDCTWLDKDFDVLLFGERGRD